MKESVLELANETNTIYNGFLAEIKKALTTKSTSDF